MRFIINFFFFGVLFYLIYLFFPDAFKTLVSWADQVVTLGRSLIDTVMERVHTHAVPPAVPPAAPIAPTSAVAMLFSLLGC